MSSSLISRKNTTEQEAPKTSPSPLRVLCSREAWILYGVLIGLGVGILMGELCTDGDETCEVFTLLLAWPGAVWMKALKALVLPLIFCNLVLCASDINKQSQSGKLPLLTVVYYVCTTVLACIVSMVLTAMIILPATPDSIDATSVCGAGKAESVSAAGAGKTAWDILFSGSSGVLTNIVPKNIIGDAAALNLLPVMVTALLLGFLIPDPENSSVIKFLGEVAGVVYKCIAFVISLTPIGVASVVFNKLASNITCFTQVAHLVGVFLGTVIFGLLFHAFVTLPLIFWLITRKNPYTVIKGAFPAMLTALSISSSAGTLPVTVRSAVENNGVTPAIANFICGLGSTINMDGTAIGFPMAVFFIALIQGTWSASTIPAGAFFIVPFVSSICSIGAAPIPSAGLTLLVVICQAVGVPTDGIGFALVVAIDWFYDRPETMVNITGDSLAAVALDDWHTSKYGKVQPENDRTSHQFEDKVSMVENGGSSYKSGAQAHVTQEI